MSSVSAGTGATVEDEVGEQDSPDAAGQRVFDAGAVDVGDEATHSWILAFVHWPSGTSVKVLSCRDSKDTERTGKATERSAASSGRDDERVISGQSREGGSWKSSNVKTYRAGHEAFNQRDFVAMTRQYADSISWTDHSQAGHSGRRQESRRVPGGWVGPLPTSGSPPCYIDAGQTVVCTFTVVGTHDGPLGLLPGTGKEFALPLCEMWHFDSSGRVVGGSCVPGFSAPETVYAPDRLRISPCGSSEAWSIQSPPTTGRWSRCQSNTAAARTPCRCRGAVEGPSWCRPR